jgi:hypothetical protein
MLRSLLVVLLLAVACRTNAQDDATARGDKFVLRSLRGRVVWLGEAMGRLHGVKTVPEAAERTLALETEDGSLHPLVEDVRGRAFRRDERLRKMHVELLVREYAGSPVVQVVRVFELARDGKLELDYWCEICSIAMYELKECDCCQGPIELRRRDAGAVKE